MDSENKKKTRFKLTQACDRCRLKRMKCDGHYPRCGPCNKKEVNCTYDMSTKRRGPKIKSAESLEEKVKQLEAQLMFRNQNISESLEKLNTKQSSVETTINIYNHGLNLLNDSEPDYTLPSQSVIDDLISLFFKITHPTIRFIHKPTLLARLNSENKPYLLLNGIFALSARFSKHPEICSSNQPRYLNGDLFANRLLTLLNQTLLSQPTLDTIQALIFLGLYAYGKMKGFSSWNYIGIAIRLAQQLGLNTIDSYHHKDNIARLSDEDWIAIECKRRTWWGCFIADRFASSLVGRSLYIDERDCLVQLPSEDARWDPRFTVISKLPPTSIEELTNFGNDLSGSSSVFCNLSSHFITLINLSGLVTRYLMHRAARGMSYDVDYRELIHLDNKLTDWASRLPTRFHHPQHFINFNASETNASTESLGDIFLAVSCMFAMYHGTLIALHRGNLSYAQNDRNGHEMVLLSKSRCIVAANEIGGLVRDAWHRLSDISDPYCPFFIFNAATIHANVVYLEPESPQIYQSKEHLDRCIKALDHFSDVWLMSKIYLEMLETLITTLTYEQNLNAQSTQIYVFSISYFDWFYSISSHDPTAFQNF
ncbi:hypothetical protein K502DRAFT_289147 [Neoconidiobolus thromboides FSU 785]|nr:hypothetical protein K502DRAFT_289147 [Neoconidiobolus thromboides FSU 785]